MDCIAGRMEAWQTYGSDCMEPHCLQLLLKGGAIFPLFEQ